MKYILKDIGHTCDLLFEKNIHGHMKIHNQTPVP